MLLTLFDAGIPAEVIAIAGIILLIAVILGLLAIGLTVFFVVRWLRKRKQ
jgi:hypothetical protein